MAPATISYLTNCRPSPHPLLPRRYAKAYAAGADSTGSAVCVGLADVSQNGTILRQQQVHTPVLQSGNQTAEAQASSSSNTGVIVGVVVAVVAACLGE